MEILRKELKPAEVKRRCICVPKEKHSLFPQIGGKLQVTDESTQSIHNVIIGSQCRLSLSSWYQQHQEACAGRYNRLPTRERQYKSRLSN